MNNLVLMVIIAGTLLLTSCNLMFEHRIAQHGTAWSKLTPTEQQRLRRGEAQVGDSEEMVLIALGAPDRKQATVGSRGEPMQAWVYWHPGERVRSKPSDSLVQDDGFAVRQPARLTLKTEIRPGSDHVIYFHDGIVALMERGAVTSYTRAAPAQK